MNSQSFYCRYLVTVIFGILLVNLASSTNDSTDPPFECYECEGDELLTCTWQNREGGDFASPDEEEAVSTVCPSKTCTSVYYLDENRVTRGCLTEDSTAATTEASNSFNCAANKGLCFETCKTDTLCNSRTLSEVKAEVRPQVKINDVISPDTRRIVELVAKTILLVAILGLLGKILAAGVDVLNSRKEEILATGESLRNFIPKMPKWSRNKLAKPAVRGGDGDAKSS